MSGLTWLALAALAPAPLSAQSPRYRPAPLAYTIDNPYRVYLLRGTDTVGPTQHEHTVESHAWRGTEQQPEVVIRQLTLDVNRRTTTDTFTIAPDGRVTPSTIARPTPAIAPTCSSGCRPSR